MICDCSEPGKILEGNTGHTASCNRLQRKAEANAMKPPKEKKPVKKVSDKMADALKKYSKERRIFLIENPRCAVYPNLPSEEIHHKKGRATIDLLLDKVFWLPVSRKAHVRIEMNPEWAKEMGYSLSRHEKNKTP